jgi:hypothetical protein
MVVAAHHPHVLASVLAPQHGRQLSAAGSALLAALDELYPTARDAVAWHQLGLDAPPGGLHVAGPLGRGLERPRAAPDRSGARGQ